MIVIVFGLPGSGKSYFAARFANALSAVYISSDIVRKEIFDERRYSSDEKFAVYEEMLSRMRKTAAEGLSIVIDATFYRADLRNRFAVEAKMFGDVAFIEVTAEDSLIKERLQQQRKDSEADYEIYKKIRAEWQPMTEPHLIVESTNENIDNMLQKAVGHLNYRYDQR